jgi:hypothetical protein
MITDILACAKAFAGERLLDGEEESLTLLCQAALDQWTGRLLPEISPEGCRAALIPASAWTALAGLLTVRQAAEPLSAISAGDLTMRLGDKEKADVASHLIWQAERLMGPYVGDEAFSFRGVRG